MHRFDGKLSSKPRPLRVTLPTSTVVFEILKVKRKLIITYRLCTIRISPDVTLSQCKYLLSILSELMSRNDAVEHNLPIC